jgi:predicted ATP-grasp superfamily ATP-dependent carboligase
MFENWYLPLKLFKQKYPNKVFLFNLINEKQINKLIKLYKIDLIIPLSLKDMKMLSQSNINCSYLSPNNYNKIDMLDNKFLFNEFMIKNELEKYIPETYIVKNNAINYNKIIRYPAIVKQSYGVGGNNIHILYSEKDLIPFDTEFIIQEYIIDEIEYIGNFIVNNGKITYSKFLKLVYNDKFFIHKSLINEFEFVEIDIEIFEIIFNKLNYTGIACSDFKIKDNVIKIFEINPRFGGTFIRNCVFYEFLETLIIS